MEALFLSVLNMSLTGSYVIAAILLARLLLRRAPRKYSFALWSVAAFRLLCPVSYSAVFSLFRPMDLQLERHAMVSAPQDIGFQLQPQVHVGIPAASDAVSQMLPPGNPVGSVNPLQVWMFVGTVLWCAGMAVLLVYGTISYVKLKQELKTATRLQGRIYENDKIRSPFILGLFRPRIYLPYGLEAAEREYVLAHEQFHLRRFDHWIKPMAWLILVLHWFNPLVWLAFHLMSRDMEMRCDEAVLAQKGQIQKVYSTALLSFASGHRFPTPSPLAFGESDVKARIRNILRWKSPKLWVTVTAAVLTIALVAACAANPPEKGEIAPEEPEQPQIIEMPEISEPEPVPQEVPAEPAPVVQEPEVQVFGEITVDTTLASALDQAVRAHCRSVHSDDHVCLWTGTILEQLVACGAAENDDPKAPVGYTRVKMMVRYAEFTVEDDRITEEGGAHLPMAFQFMELQDGSLVLEEIWQPRDGSYYAEDIRAEFMEENWEAAMDTQRYIEQHNRELYQQLVQCNYVNLDAALMQLEKRLADDPTDVTVQRQLRYLGYHPLAGKGWMTAEPGTEGYGKFHFLPDGTGTYAVGDQPEQPFTYAYSEDYAQLFLTYADGSQQNYTMEMQGRASCTLTDGQNVLQLNGV